MDKLLKEIVPVTFIRNLVERLKIKRHDELGREQGQTVVRIVIVTLMLPYFAVSFYPVEWDTERPSWLTFILGFLCWSVALAMIAFRDVKTSVVRRTIANVGDVVAISYLMIASGKIGVPLFALYLWITLGNGFRFGIRSMSVSALLSLAGFWAVLAVSPVWQQLVTVAIAVIVSLISLPLYAAHFLRQRSAAWQDKLRPQTASRPAIGSDTTAPISGSHSLSRERGQAITRLGVCSVVFIYLLIYLYPISTIEPWLLFCFGYLAFSVLVLTLANLDTGHPVARRTLANVADVGAISYLMIATGDIGFPLFVLYLWITLGNGFRFGVRPMVVSAALCVIGFAVVVFLSDLWNAHSMLAVGVVTALVLIPGYTAHLIEKVHQARQHAEEASAAKGRFLARMSHELRTPLNGILGATELLATNKRLSPEDHTLLDVIRESVRLSLRQIENVLDFSKIEAGKLTLEQTAFDLHELLNRTARLVRGVALDKNLRLMLRISPAVPYPLVGDPHYVQEVLLNLLANAIKFTEKGYVSLDVELVEKDERSALIRLAVHDTGVGIDPQALTRIFDAFSQEDASTTRRYGGTGLGTTIAKQLVELMGGRIEVASRKNAGSVFSAEIRFAVQQNALASEASFGGMQILLVSENQALRDHVAAQAGGTGLLLTTATSVGEAVGLLARGIRLKNPIHAVLVDASAAITAEGKHRGDDFLEKAWLSFTPVFLVCDISPADTQLRKWGYASPLSYSMSRETLFNALHTCGFHGAVAGSGVVQIEPWAWGQSPRQRARILAADDNTTNLSILKKILESANFDVDTAMDGEQALDKLLNNRYKAAVLDMHMPGLDGTDVIKQYRLLNTGARIPIVMLTANATMDARIDSADAGADAYLTKPAMAETVLTTLRRLLDETEVYDLSRLNSEKPEKPILNPDIIAEMDRLYNDPTGIAQLLNDFERDGRRLLDNLAAALKSKNHAAFSDVLHALRGISAGVGGLRLADLCHEFGACGLLEFRREGESMLRRVEEELALAAKALREFTAVGGPGPTHGGSPS